MDKIPDAREGPQPAVSEEAAGDRPEIHRTKGGELIVWAPQIKSAIRPIVTLGRFRDGNPAIHLRHYRVRGDGIAVMTNEGVTFRVDELVELVDRLRVMFDAIPSLRAEVGRP